MRYILYILTFILVTSCLTQKRFNKVLDKGIEKGWIDTTTIRIDTVFKNRIDTVLLTKEVERIVDSIITKTLIKDTCYDKKGNYLGAAFNKKKLEKELKDKILDSLIIPNTICLKKPLFLETDNAFVEISQLSNGDFTVKVEVKDTIINRPSEKNWFRRYVADVWFSLLFIGLLIVALILKK